MALLACECDTRPLVRCVWVSERKIYAHRCKWLQMRNYDSLLFIIRVGACHLVFTLCVCTRFIFYAKSLLCAPWRHTQRKFVETGSTKMKIHFKMFQLKVRCYLFGRLRVPQQTLACHWEWWRALTFNVVHKCWFSDNRERRKKAKLSRNR